MDLVHPQYYKMDPARSSLQLGGLMWSTSDTRSSPSSLCRESDMAASASQPGPPTDFWVHRSIGCNTYRVPSFADEPGAQKAHACAECAWTPLVSSRVYKIHGRCSSSKGSRTPQQRTADTFPQGGWPNSLFLGPGLHPRFSMLEYEVPPLVFPVSNRPAKLCETGQTRSQLFVTKLPSKPNTNGESQSFQLLARESEKPTANSKKMANSPHQPGRVAWEQFL